jgi:hypothetical protein
VAANGPRGSGKSLLLAALACEVMIGRGQPVWSNMGICWDTDKMGAVPGGPRKGKWESHPLNKDALVAFDTEDMTGGWVIWDEIQNDVDSRRPMSLGNILFSKVMAQIRKRQLCVGYSCQYLEMIDTRMRWQTDLQYLCTDLHVRGSVEDEDDRPPQRGVVIGWERRNLSGYLKGPIYGQTGFKTTGTFYGKRFWKAYSTNEVQNPLESMIPYKLALGEKQIGLGQSSATADLDAQVAELISGFKGEDRVPVSEVIERAQSMGIETDKTRLGSSLKRQGVFYHPTRTENFYIFGGSESKPRGGTKPQSKAVADFAAQMQAGKTPLQIIAEATSGS